jgi:hypothetical protein
MNTQMLLTEDPMAYYQNLVRSLHNLLLNSHMYTARRDQSYSEGYHLHKRKYSSHHPAQSDQIANNVPLRDRNPESSCSNYSFPRRNTAREVVTPTLILP